MDRNIATCKGNIDCICDFTFIGNINPVLIITFKSSLVDTGPASPSSPTPQLRRYALSCALPATTAHSRISSSAGGFYRPFRNRSPSFCLPNW